MLETKPLEDRDSAFNSPFQLWLGPGVGQQPVQGDGINQGRAGLRSQGWTASSLSALPVPHPFHHALLSLMECPAVLRGLASPDTSVGLNQQSKTFKAIAEGLP